VAYWKKNILTGAGGNDRERDRIGSSREGSQLLAESNLFHVEYRSFIRVCSFYISEGRDSNMTRADSKRHEAL
jgi:hypothetical protein